MIRDNKKMLFRQTLTAFILTSVVGSSRDLSRKARFQHHAKKCSLMRILIRRHV